jgi:hypothetical protein
MTFTYGLGIEEGLSGSAGVSFNKTNSGESAGIQCAYAAGVGGYGEGGSNGDSGYGEGGVVFGEAAGCAAYKSWTWQWW